MYSCLLTLVLLSDKPGLLFASNAAKHMLNPIVTRQGNSYYTYSLLRVRRIGYASRVGGQKLFLNTFMEAINEGHWFESGSGNRLFLLRTCAGYMEIDGAAVGEMQLQKKMRVTSGFDKSEAVINRTKASATGPPLRDRCRARGWFFVSFVIYWRVLIRWEVRPTVFLRVGEVNYDIRPIEPHYK